jgi:hypothetical protein
MLQTQVQSLQSEVNHLQQQTSNIANDNQDNAVRAKKDLKASEQNMKSTIDDLTHQNNDLQKTIDNQTKQIASLKDWQSHTNRELKSLRQSSAPVGPPAPVPHSTSPAPHCTSPPTSNSPSQKQYTIPKSLLNDGVSEISDTPLDDDISPTPPPTPLHSLTKSIPAPCDELLIGDSIMCRVGEPSSSRGAHGALLKDLSVRGLKVEDVLQWLSSLSPAKHIRLVTMHVGITTCLETGTIDEATWQRVVKALRRAFPDAKLLASSIIPPFGRHHASTAVEQSNSNLSQACAREDVVFVNHTASFQTETGAPKKPMYKHMDRFHPSPAGVAAITRSIRHRFKPLLPTPLPRDHGNSQRLFNKPSQHSEEKKRRISAVSPKTTTQREQHPWHAKAPPALVVPSRQRTGNGHQSLVRSEEDYPPLPQHNGITALGSTKKNIPGSSPTLDTRVLLQTLVEIIQQAL